MPTGNVGVKTKGRSLDVMSAIKKRIAVAKAALNWLAYSLITLGKKISLLLAHEGKYQILIERLSVKSNA